MRVIFQTFKISHKEFKAVLVKNPQVSGKRHAYYFIWHRRQASVNCRLIYTYRRWPSYDVLDHNATSYDRSCKRFWENVVKKITITQNGVI